MTDGKLPLGEFNPAPPVTQAPPEALNLLNALAGLALNVGGIATRSGAHGNASLGLAQDGMDRGVRAGKEKQQLTNAEDQSRALQEQLKSLGDVSPKLIEVGEQMKRARNVAGLQQLVSGIYRDRALSNRTARETDRVTDAEITGEQKAKDPGGAKEVLRVQEQLKNSGVDLSDPLAIEDAVKKLNAGLSKDEQAQFADSVVEARDQIYAEKNKGRSFGDRIGNFFSGDNPPKEVTPKEVFDRVRKNNPEQYKAYMDKAEIDLLEQIKAEKNSKPLRDMLRTMDRTSKEGVLTLPLAVQKATLKKLMGKKPAERKAIIEALRKKQGN